ncbi:oxidoreductase [Clostridiales bacterium]|nr:oxidoreductase [Clostridiales bacterium]
MNNLTMIENGLVPVYITDTGERVVYGTELHNGLGVNSNYRDWIKNRINDCDAVEHEDYEGDKILAPSGQKRQEHVIKLAIAKEMAMLERNDQGKQVRRYFINLETKWNSPEMIMKRALEFADAKVKELESQVEESRPAVIFANAVSASQDCILVRELAKFLKQNGVDIGQNKLFAWLRENGYLIKQKGDDWNTPTQKSMDLELFEVEEAVFTRADGTTKTKPTTKVTGKGQQYFINKFLENQNTKVIEGCHARYQ